MINGVKQGLEEGLQLIESIDDGIYAKEPHLSKSSIGKHFRHILDHFESLRFGLSKGKVEYDHRIRGTDVETSREAAITAIIQNLEWLDTLTEAHLIETLVVGQDLSTSGNGYCEYNTTLGRELLFVASHTVHHYALIRDLLRNEVLPEGFGVAASTIRFEQTGAA